MSGLSPFRGSFFAGSEELRAQVAAYRFILGPCDVYRILYSLQRSRRTLVGVHLALMAVPVFERVFACLWSCDCEGANEDVDCIPFDLLQRSAFRLSLLEAARDLSQIRLAFVNSCPHIYVSDDSRS